MKVYKILTPPITLDFQSRTTEELKKFYRWFIDIKKERIELITELIQSSDLFKDSKLDFSPESLIIIGDWFYMNVIKRSKTEQELVDSNLPVWLNDLDENWELTNATFSKAIDVAIYFSEVLLRNNEKLKMKHCITGRKDYISYGQPVIAGFKNKMEFNPIHMMVNTAYGFAQQSFEGKRLKDLYDMWIKMYT